MDEQKAILNYLISNNLPLNQAPYTQINNHGIDYYATYHTANPDGWNTTLAPDSATLSSNYARYIYPIPTIEEPSQADANKNFIEINTNEGKYFPYLPGWSLYQISNNNFWVNAISSGIDCTDFVQIAASYNSNNYSCGLI